MDFDRVLEKCGNFGRFQLILLLLYGYTNIQSSMHYFTQTIITFTPPHWCNHPKLMNASFDEIRSVYAQVEHPSCTLLQDIRNGTAIVQEGGKCEDWIFEYEMGYQSLTTELKWVCEDAFQSAMGQSFFFIGSVLGTIFFGFLADKIGRLPALLVSTLTGATGDFLTSFINSVPTFTAARFMAGLSTDTQFYIMYIMVFEYLSPKKRTFGLNIITAFFYCVGLMLSPWYAVWLGSWRLYLLVASLPAIGMLCYPFFICESAQWLITRQNYQGAVKCLKRVAAFNRREVPESVFVEFVKHYEQKYLEEKKLKDNTDNFLGMFRTPRMRRFTIILLIKSMIITLTFDIISRNMEGLGSSPFMLFSFTSITYIPGGLAIILLQNRIGRKGMACGCLFIGGIITAITGFLIAFLDRQHHAILLACMVGLGRFGAIVAYDAEAQYAAEIIPTSVRGQGMSNIHVVGYAISFLSSYIIYLGRFYKPLPSIFISVIMFLGAALCLCLPETLNKKLPETLSDGEMFGLNEKWYFFPCFGKPADDQKEPSEENPSQTNPNKEIT